ncbi:hypothetical protein EV141_0267 [Microcella putealis]|uniref:Tic20 family protein n=1 Tax=Microcella putealis TaxID=337005 RepID=A0A4V2EXC9_9MICO|nr:DUF4870 domain-containing protein [Microcella putealis]RZS59050.1 hypothetical protein EV141_0267 [Microcella putealis]TQM24076.1 hypothetical protein BJ957_1546 [Microcella putealis]
MTDTPPPPPPQGASTSGAALSESEDRQWASFAHLGGIIGLLPSLIIYLVFKDRGSFTRQESKEALNFQITMAIGQIAIFIINSVLTAVTFGIWAFIGWILPLALWVLSLIWSIMGFSKAKDGVAYRYPIAIRLVK